MSTNHCWGGSLVKFVATSVKRPIPHNYWMPATKLQSSPVFHCAIYNRMSQPNSSKSTGTCLDMLDVLQLLLHLAAVSAVIWLTPGHNSPRFKNGSKSQVICLDLLDIPQLLLHLAAVSATMCPTPGHNIARFKNGSKSTIGSCLDVLDVPQLLLHLAAVSDPRSQQPQIQEWQQKPGHLLGFVGHSSAALTPGCCLHRNLHYPRSQQWQQKHILLLGCAGRSSAALAPGCCLRPQVTTAPDSRMAAKARSFAWICWTFLSCSCTWLLSPPRYARPQVTTAPDSRMAAKAYFAA